MRRKYREAERAFNDKGYGRLATYNSECWRGIVHTEEYRAEMKALQAQFNAEMKVEVEREGGIVV